MTVDLKNKPILITGASLGIGREIAYGFAAEGARLALTYFVDRAEGAAAAERCRALGATDVMLERLDAGDDASIRNCVAAAVEHLGSIAILVNNAGVVVWKRLEDMTFAEIERQVRVNLEGLIKTTRVALPYVDDAIINIGSTAGLHGTATLAPYGASKWGVRGFTKALAKEHPEKRIYAVHPTVTATRMNDFQGMAPERVGAVVLRVARGELDLEPGADVDVRDYVA